MEVIDLTERQAEVANWLMGTPFIEHWDEQEEPAEFQLKFDRPKLQGRKMAVPESGAFVEIVEQELDRFQDMQMDAAEVDTVQSMIGLQRVCRNLTEKIRKVAAE